MIVADASWVIALRDPLDPHHRHAVALNDATVDDAIIMHRLTLAECLVGAARVGRLDEAADAMRAAFDIVDSDLDAPLRWASLRATTRLRLPDVVVLDTATVHGASMILTFDQELTAAAQARAMTPPLPDTS